MYTHAPTSRTAKIRAGAHSPTFLVHLLIRIGKQLFHTIAIGAIKLVNRQTGSRIPFPVVLLFEYKNRRQTRTRSICLAFDSDDS